MSSMHERRYEKHSSDLSKLQEKTETQSFGAYFVGAVLTLSGLLTTGRIISYFSADISQWIGEVYESRLVGGLSLIILLLLVFQGWYILRNRHLKKYAKLAKDSIEDFETLLDSHDALAKDNARLLVKADNYDLIIASYLNSMNEGETSNEK